MRSGFRNSYSETEAVRFLVFTTPMRRTRLITILAPGGMGKTWLALEIARHCLENSASKFPNGIFFVALAQLDNAEHLVTSIAEQLGIQFYGADEPKQQLLNYLREKHIFWPQKICFFYF